MDFQYIINAKERLGEDIVNTPVLVSEDLNNMYGHNFYFKCENFQHIRAFKARGALNTLRWLNEQGALPAKVKTHSSGNHAQAIAWAAKKMRVKADIYMPTNSSAIKIQSTRSLGANVILGEKRADIEVLAETPEEGAVFVHPFNHEQTISGQGTACLEALSKVSDIDAVFAPIGGGGLISGTYLAAKGVDSKIKVFGVEPDVANDAVRSVRQGSIFKWPDTPNTYADGVRTLAVGEVTFEFIKKLDNIFEASVDDMIFWTQMLTHYLSCRIETSSSLGMSAAVEWSKTQKSRRNILVIISGGNMDAKTTKYVWQEDRVVFPTC